MFSTSKYVSLVAVAAASVFAFSASAALSIVRFDNDTAGNNAINGVGGNKAVHPWVAEGRIGNTLATGTHELDLGKTTNGPFVPDNSADKTKNVAKQLALTSGSSYSFTIVYNPATPLVTYTFGSTVMEYIPTGLVDALLIRGRSPVGGSLSSMALNNLSIDGNLLGQSILASSSSATGVDILLVSGSELSDGFTLTGDAVFTWTGTAPTNSALAFQIKADTVVPEPSALGALSAAGLMALRRRRA